MAVQRIEEAVKTTLWQMWHEGKPIEQIAKKVNRKRPSVFVYLERHGGIEPAQRTRSSRVLSTEEREEISRGVHAGHSLRHIARQLKRSPSTVSREVNRNGGPRGYRACSADQNACRNALRPKRCLLAREQRLCEIVTSKLGEDWSPDQISRWLCQNYPSDESMRVSHETIYKTLFIQSRGALRKDLRDHLRTRRRFRQSKHRSPNSKGNSPIKDPISISERPAQAEDRAVPGHWEGDLIEGLKGTFIATLVERSTRYVILARVRSKHTAEVVDALVREMQNLPLELKKTLTWDRGSELAAHKQFAIASDIEVYFCDPGSPWQRGSNENTNGLLRQYFPKSSDLSYHTQAELDLVAAKLNGRPRKTLGYMTPADKLKQVVNESGVATTH